MLSNPCRKLAVTNVVLGFVQPNTYSAHQDCKVSQLMFPISSSQARVQYVVLMILLCPLMLCLATIPSVTIAYGQTVRRIPNFPVQHVQSELTQCADGPKHSSQARHCGASVLSHNSQVQIELRPVSS